MHLHLDFSTYPHAQPNHPCFYHFCSFNPLPPNFDSLFTHLFALTFFTFLTNPFSPSFIHREYSSGNSSSKSRCASAYSSVVVSKDGDQLVKFLLVKNTTAS